MSVRHPCVSARLIALAAVIVTAAMVFTSRLTEAQSAAPSAYPTLPLDRALALVDAANRKLDYLPGEVLVKFKAGVSIPGQQRALQALRSRPAVSDLHWIGDVARFKDPVEWDATVLAAQLVAQPEVEYAEPNYLYHANADPNDPGFATRQWNLNALEMGRVWDINPGAKDSVTVAVVDYGITTVNQVLAFPTWTGDAIQTINVPFKVNPDLALSRLVSPRDVGVGTGLVLDMDGHGTHVSSTIGEDANNALAEAGIAYNVKIMPVKACQGFWEIQFAVAAAGVRGFVPLDVGGCPASDLAEGIRYAANGGAKVINISLGGSAPTMTVRNAMIEAVGKGAFIAVAAGNEFEEGNPVDYPAFYAQSIDGAMAVGAVGRSLRRAYYSNTGSHIEIAAPGGDGRDGGLAGEIWQSTISGSDANPEMIVFPRFDRYFETPYQGTSMAAPHVSGIAALIISQGVTSPAAVEALIKATARDLGATGRDNEYGYGLIQPRAALRGVGIK